VETYPEGLEKMITENGKNISGGQQQRIAIARALYKKADLSCSMNHLMNWMRSQR
jgi:ABC-type bacteriocin/lantibiotic exporter with double-glycine peptidase domain